MVNLAGLSQGFIRRGHEDKASRREAALAFQEFRRTNPTATAAEMQQMIDTLGGGRNYIQGGLPSGEVLQAIAEQNAQAAARQKVQHQVEDMRQRQEISGSIQQTAEGLLTNLGRNTTQQDLNDLQQDFMSQIGGQEGIPEGINVSQYFTMDNLNNIRSQRAREYVPQALNIARSSGGKIDASSLKALYPNIPEGIADAAIALGEEDYSRERSQWLLSNRQALGDLITSEVASGREGTVRDLLVEYATNSGNHLTEEEITNFENDAKRLAEKRDEDRQRGIDTENSNATIKFYQDVASDPDIINAVEVGNNEQAEALIETIIRLNPPSVQDALRAEKTNVLNARIQTAQVLQDNYIDEQNRAADVQVADLANTLREQNRNNIFQHFGRLGDSNPNVGLNGDNAINAALDLAPTYEMSSENLTGLGEVFSQFPEGTNRTDLRNAGIEYLESIKARKMTDFISESQDTAKARLGAIGQDITFAKWRDNTTTDYFAKVEEVEQRYREIVLREPDPAKRNARLAATANALSQIEQITFERVNALRDYAGGKKGWITHGTPPWNEEEVTGEEGMLTLFSRDAARLQKLIEDAMVKIEPQPVEGQELPDIDWEALTGDVSEPAPSEKYASTVINRTINEVKATYANNTSNNFYDATDTAQRAYLASYLDTNAPSLARHFLQIERDRGTSARQVATLKFKRDPMAYIRSISTK